MSRRSASEINEIKNLVKKIMLEENITSPAKVAEVLKEQYWKSVSKQTLLNMCSEIKNSGLVKPIEQTDTLPELTSSEPITTPIGAATKKAIELE